MGGHPTVTLKRLAVLLCTTALVCAAGRAYANDESLAVLGVDSEEVTDVIGGQVTEALRKQAAETPGVRLVPGKELVELKLVFGCDGEAPACLAQAGRTLGADKLLYGTLRKADGGKGIAVALKLLDVRGLAIVKQVNEVVPRKTFAGAVITSSVARWFGQLVVAPQTGGIAIQSTPADAQVLLDGVAVGHTPARARDIKPGPHTVTITLDGYQPATRSVDVHIGALETVIVRLDREAHGDVAHGDVAHGDVARSLVVDPVAPQPLFDAAQKPLHPGRPATYAGIGLVAGAVIAGAVAIYTWRSYLSLEGTAHNDLTSLATPGASPDLQSFLGKPTCKTPPGSASAASESYLAHCDSGNRYAHATTGLWISAGVLATAGIVSFIIGDRLDAKAAKDRRAGRRLESSLRLLPAVSTKGGGLQASFEF
ncbi:MAG: PEGA domain-containing protein [Polyangia bacterium]